MGRATAGHCGASRCLAGTTVRATTHHTTAAASQGASVPPLLPLLRLCRLLLLLCLHDSGAGSLCRGEPAPCVGAKEVALAGHGLQRPLAYSL